jgi:hypothetical protein
MKENEMSEACGMDGRRTCIGFWWGILKDHLEGFIIVARIILKRILQKCAGNG